MSAPQSTVPAPQPAPQPVPQPALQPALQRAGEATGRADAGRRARRRVRAAVLTAAALAVPAGASPALAASAAPAAAGAPAARPAPVRYAALGDSYSSGVGTGRTDAGASCRRSSLAYPRLWTAAHPGSTVSFLACSGAGLPRVLAQQVTAVPKDAGLVTVTAGGNDVGFSAVVGVCALASSDTACRFAVGLAKVVAVTEVPVALGATLAAIKYRAPHARIVVLGYPHLFELGSCPAAVPSVNRRKAINDGADTLDGAISRTASAFGAQFVDVRARFAGHGLCAPAGQSWINGPERGPDAYHPTATGQARGYLPALTAVTG